MERLAIRHLVVVISAAIVFAFNIAVAQAAPLSMTIGYSDSTGSIYDVSMKTFKKNFEKYTHGKVQVHLYCCMQMGGEQENVKKLQLGVLDGTMVAQNNLEPVFPLIDVLVLPYIIQNLQHGLRVLNGPIGTMMKDRLLKETGIRVISWPQMVFRNLYNKVRPINSIEDLKGIRWRVPSNTVMINTFKAFGVTPVPLAYSQLMSGLQTGTVQGGNLPISAYYSNKYWEVCKNVAITGNFFSVAPFLVSDSFYQKLNPQEQKALYRAGKEAAEAGRKFAAKSEKMEIAKLKQYGVKFTHPDHKPFIEAAKKVWQQFKEEHKNSKYADYGKLVDDIVAAGPAK